MTSFTEFYDTLRVLLGDTDPYQVFDYQDGALDSALRAVFLLGRSPAGYALSGDRQTSAEIDPDIPNGNDFALISYEAAMMMVGGDSGSMSYRTRALSVTRTGDKPKTLLGELRQRIYEIKGGADQFSSIESFVTWVHSIQSVPEQVLASTPAPTLPEGRFNIGVY